MSKKLDKDQIETMVIEAEREIRNRLLRLQEETAGKVSSVEVDTKSYANLVVLIWLEDATHD